MLTFAYRCPAIASALVLLLAGLAGVAWAVMPPQVYLEARKTADHHVQVAILETVVPGPTPGACRISGNVVTVFRSRGDVLQVGTPVAFAVDCARPGDDLMPGPVLWGDVVALQQADFIEAYLNGEHPDAVTVARWQYALIDGPTATPQCPEDAPAFGCH